MSFNSYVFVFLFLPITIIGYFWLNHRNHNWAARIFLLGMSLYFYGYANINYLKVLGLSIVVNYAACLIISCFSEKKVFSKSAFVLGILFNITLLFYYKYTNFFISSMNLVFKSDYNLLNLMLPLGISFMTFQQISYVVDLYEGKIKQCSFLDYALFVSFFPDISSGPILLHGLIIPQFHEESRHHFDTHNFNKGMYLFAMGLGKKVLVADTLGKVVDSGFDSIASLGALITLFVVLAYTLQLYFDFSGYSDMARGIGMMLNIDIPVNFNSPYKAVNINDFWKRWHITLTQFLTTYIYIPLGGNRKGTVRTYINIMIVFLVSGLWHGASFTFILWGLMHGIASCVYRIGRKFFDKLPNFLNRLITFSFVSFAWIAFRSSSITQFIQVIKQLFSKGDIFANSSILTDIYLPEVRYLFNLSSLLDEHVILIACFILLVLLLFVFKSINSNERSVEFKENPRYLITTTLIIVWCILAFSRVGTFIYSNF